MGYFHEALSDLLRADELHRAELAAHYGGENKVWGGMKGSLTTAYLFLHETESAERELRADMKGILEWPDCFTDAAGGVGPGLLLWYIGVRDNDKAVEGEALAYLRHILRISRKEKFKQWPHHLAKFVLDTYSFAAMLDEAFQCMDLDELERRAYVEPPPPPPGEVPKFDVNAPPTGMLLRGRLAQALFYGGIKARRTHREIGDDLLRRCTRLKDVDIENEWYLAFLELGMIDSARHKG
ncbi:MAG: hypothetical protein KF754_12195 [Planctomycetes bacterium]|nr:hypothetical protein [Planctomycetota bacterium]